MMAHPIARVWLLGPRGELSRREVSDLAMLTERLATGEWDG